MAWADDFEQVHGYPPSAQDVADHEWSLDFQAQNGRPPNQDEWNWHNYTYGAGAGGGAAGAGAGVGGAGVTNGGYAGGATPYGGSAWIQQLIETTAQAVMAQLQGQQMTGYYTPGQYQPGAQRAPTLTEAYHAIYQNRPDLQQQRES